MSEKKKDPKPKPSKDKTENVDQPKKNATDKTTQVKEEKKEGNPVKRLTLISLIVLFFLLYVLSDRHAAGMVSMVDVDFAKIQVQDALAAIESLTRSQVQTENALSILIGIPPQNIPRGLHLYDQQVVPDLPTGMPSYLLE